MAFCSFSKDCDDNSYTLIENKFITKYMPEADGFAVQVYLYGLYLCEHGGDKFSLASMAEVLKTSEEKIKAAFIFWEDYDLVQIIAKEPFTVQYLPVRSAIGKPKKVRYEQYADFNKELQRKMQKVGKFISAGDYIKYMRFLEENDIQPQAFLLIAEYCIIRGTAQQLSIVDPGAVIGSKLNAYGGEMLVKRSAIPAEMTYSPITIEELFLFMIKEAK
jgi:hypothetical protein